MPEVIDAKLLEVADPGPFSPLNTHYRLGDRITLLYTAHIPVLQVSGYFALFFLDDDPDFDHGPTMRILADDDQVWESTEWEDERPEAEVFTLEELPPFNLDIPVGETW